MTNRARSGNRVPAAWLDFVDSLCTQVEVTVAAEGGLTYQGPS